MSTQKAKVVDKPGMSTRLEYKDKNGLTKSVNVEKVENGWIIRINRYGNIKDKWIDENKTYISSTNPFAKKDNSPAPEELFDLIQRMEL